MNNNKVVNLATHSKSKHTRNKHLLNLIKKAKVNINIEEELLDALMIVQTTSGKVIFFGQTLVPSDPLACIGLLEVAKLEIQMALTYIEVEDD